MMPENLQERNVRRFKGFTPQQVQKLLEGKGLKPNSREAAEYLGAMANKAEDLLQRSKANTMHQGQGFQMGGQVGGFDPQSQKLFDAAVKRVSGNQPQTPEVQRYLDNVIETRGRPTMVFPNTADPLQNAMPQQGYQQGGLTPPTTSHPLPTGDIGIPSFGNRRDPLPTPTTPGSDAGTKQKAGLNQAQANLASAHDQLSSLQQHLASTPIEYEASRNALIEKINQQGPKITAAESALASASSSFQTAALPTASEAVGSAVSTPSDVITRQPVDKLVATTQQTIDPTYRGWSI